MQQFCERMFLMAQMIPTEPRFVTVESLQDKLGAYGFYVTKRTVQRDLHKLSKLLYLRVCRCGKTNRWFAVSNAIRQLETTK